ncbi:MAG: PhnD/SsuA/transferrin family substrate-binding protein [Pseudomonadota bacterium]
MKFSLQIIFLTIILFLFSCSDEKHRSEYYPAFSDNSPSSQEVYIFGVHPLHNPQRLFAVFGPLIDHLSENIPNALFKLEASRNYAAYDKKLYAGKFHFSLPNPFQTINSLEKGYQVFAKMGDDNNFRGIILVRKDSGIKHVQDLKGKAISYPAPTALAATMMPQYYLQTHGLNVMKDLDNRYVGSQESSIMNVFLKQTAAASTWPPPWNALIKERPELEKQLEIKWQTPPLPNNGLVARKDIKASLTKQVKEILTHLHEHKQGRKILQRMGLSKFESADNNTYQPVRDFIKQFIVKVRPL